MGYNIALERFVRSIIHKTERAVNPENTHWFFRVRGGASPRDGYFAISQRFLIAKVAKCHLPKKQSRHNTHSQGPRHSINKSTLGLFQYIF
jgi:hypothetical protein